MKLIRVVVAVAVAVGMMTMGMVHLIIEQLLLGIHFQNLYSIRGGTALIVKRQTTMSSSIMEMRWLK